MGQFPHKGTVNDRSKDARGGPVIQRCTHLVCTDRWIHQPRSHGPSLSPPQSRQHRTIWEVSGETSMEEKDVGGK